MPWTSQAQEAANFLCRMPTGHTTMTRRDLQSLLLETGGQLMASGYLCDIKTKHLGAGVYRVELKKV